MEQAIGMMFGTEEIQGFWVHLEHDVRTGRPELRMLLDAGDYGLFPVILHIGPWTVTEAVDRMMSQSMANFPGFQKTDAITQALAAEANPLVSIILYFMFPGTRNRLLKATGSRPLARHPKKDPGRLADVSRGRTGVL